MAAARTEFLFSEQAGSVRLEGPPLTTLRS